LRNTGGPLLSPTAENRLLASLPANELARMEPLLELEAYPQGAVLSEAGGSITHVAFPLDCVLSSVTVMSDDASIEGLLCGNEGLSGGASLVGVVRSPWRVVVQVEGRALSALVASVVPELGHMPVLQQRIARHEYALQQQATQSVACNRFHPIHERLARWLLMVLDRTGNPEISLTHEFIAQMLGAYRPSVTVAVSTLERAGIVHRGRRGRLVVPDRAALEAASCECYRRALEYLRETELPASARHD